MQPDTMRNVDKNTNSREFKSHLEDDLQEININLEFVYELEGFLNQNQFSL